MPLREFGGVSRTELLKSFWTPVTLATELTNIGDYPAAKIDHAGDFAKICMKIPDSFLTLLHLRAAELWVIPIATNADMHLTTNYDFALNGQAYNTFSGVATHHLNVTANIIYVENIIELTGIDRTCIMGLECLYNADALHLSNLYVLGLNMRWW